MLWDPHARRIISIAEYQQQGLPRSSAQAEPTAASWIARSGHATTQRRQAWH
jgi:hypothetical protein